ncbi:MAG TPA: hypothetical protein VJR29_14800 [bacterium]|nr:hypothetical protein [bacterium]
MLVHELLESLGPDPEARLGRSVFRELQALAGEGDAELFWQEALRLADRLERGDRLDSAAALYGTVAQSAAASFPGLSARAGRSLQAMAGEGEGGARFEFLLHRLSREASDPWMIAGFGVGSLAFRAAKLGALSRLWSPGQGFFLGRRGAGLLASAAGLSVETPVFLFSTKLGHQLGGAPQDWRGETLGHELAGVGLTLFCLKGAGALSREAVQALQGSPLARASVLGRLAQAAAPQVGLLGGIAGARRGEEALGLRPHSNEATLLADTFSTYLQFLVGARLADRVLGAGFQSLQRRMDWRAENLAGASSRIPALAFAAATSAGGKLGAGASIQELAQSPLLSSAFDDGNGDKSNPALEVPRQFGFGRDTVSNRWFPLETSQPSNAVPMFTSSVEAIPRMLTSAYRHRQGWHYPRTIVLEPGLEAMQKISPSALVTPAYLNALTKDLGEKFPDRTPFRILQVAQRKTFTGRVEERRLLWTEENDPIWRLNRYSGTHEFEAETPLDLYLYIESQTRQPRPSPDIEYQVRFQGQSPKGYELSYPKFIERTLRFYRIAGKSFNVELGDGVPPYRYRAPEGDWTLEDAGRILSPLPSAAASEPGLEVTLKAEERPIFPRALTPTEAKKPGLVQPFAVVTSLQGMKDVASRLSDRSTPRRIELWFEGSASGIPTNVESWQHIFRDLRAGCILVVHDNRTQKTHTFQRLNDQVQGRSSGWNRPLAWEPGIALSSSDVMDLLQQLQYTRQVKLEDGQTLSVSILRDWEPNHGKMLVNVLNQWGDLAFGKIEIRPRRHPETSLNLYRNHAGKFELSSD